MHRSSSTTRASDEFFLSTTQGTVKGSSPGRRSTMEIDQLPTYDPQSEIGKKEALRLRFAENMVHIIPVVLILCAVVLWFFSHPEIDLVSKDDSIVARIKNMSIDGYNNWTDTSLTVGLEDLDTVRQIGGQETERDLENKEHE